MTLGARTPEELDTLLEDAFVLRDRDGLTALFEKNALLVQAGGLEVRGGEAIVRSLADLWAGERSYFASPRRVLRTRDTALVTADGAVHVLRRGSDGAWRSAISLLKQDPSIRPENA